MTGDNSPPRNRVPRSGRPPGRPSKLTPDVRMRIMNAVRCGAPLRTAAVAGGVSESTFRAWRLKAEQPGARREYKVFVEELKRAEQEGQAARLAIIQKAATRDWRAAAWLVERRCPEEFSVRYQMEHGGRVEVDVSRWVPAGVVGDGRLQESGVPLVEVPDSDA